MFIYSYIYLFIYLFIYLLNISKALHFVSLGPLPWKCYVIMQFITADLASSPSVIPL